MPTRSSPRIGRYAASRPRTAKSTTTQWDCHHIATFACHAIETGAAREGGAPRAFRAASRFQTHRARHRASVVVCSFLQARLRAERRRNQVMSQVSERSTNEEDTGNARIVPRAECQWRSLAHRWFCSQPQRGVGNGRGALAAAGRRHGVGRARKDDCELAEKSPAPVDRRSLGPLGGVCQKSRSPRAFQRRRHRSQTARRRPEEGEEAREKVARTR